jgi:hypothetical protein
MPPHPSSTATLSTVCFGILGFLFSGCGRSDPFAFDRYDENAGDGGTDTGGRSSGGSDPGGKGGFPGTGGASTGGFAGKGGCPGELASCDGSCVDLRSDEAHCGSCFAYCSFGTECFDGYCTSVCPGAAFCFGNCTDISRDPFNCGACGNVCPSGLACNYGYCDAGCGPERITCGDTCVDPYNDPFNCGGCGYQCGTGGICSGAVCVGTAEQSYTASASPLSFINACVQPGATVVLRAIDDDVYSRIGIPWFNFFGVPSQIVWVSSNGVLGFGNPDPGFSNECFFSYIDRAVFAFWDDLLTGPDGVCLAEIGASPNRLYVATWQNTAILQSSQTTSLTFSIVLSESTQTIDVLYERMVGGGQLSAGASATIGLGGFQQYFLDCCNQPCVRNNVGRRYTPILR